MSALRAESSARRRNQAVTIPCAAGLAVDREAGGGAGEGGRDQIGVKGSRRDRAQDEQTEGRDFLPGHVCGR